MIKVKDGVETTARFSECGQYRYRLTRVWDQNLPMVNWLMMNPSIANEERDDPTVAKCQRYARRWGKGGIIVTNCFALISTDPKALRTHESPIGPMNNSQLLSAAMESSLVICAWGNPSSFMDRGQYVYNMLINQNVELHCLKINKNGESCHPLYLKEELDPIPYVR
jgi:hypothetical protein